MIASFLFGLYLGGAFQYFGDHWFGYDIPEKEEMPTIYFCTAVGCSMFWPICSIWEWS